MTTSPVRINHDRRDPIARAALQRRVRGEFEEMPGTVLTCPQARRLFGLKPDVCERVLGALVREGILSRTTGDRYRLNDSATWPGHRAFLSHLTSATSKAS